MLATIRNRISFRIATLGLVASGRAWFELVCHEKKDTAFIRDPNDKKETTLPWNEQQKWEREGEASALNQQQRNEEPAAGAPAALNPEPGRDNRVLRHHHDPVADKIISRVQVRRFSFRRNHDAVRDPRILVDDRPVDHAILPDPDRR